MFPWAKVFLCEVDGLAVGTLNSPRSVLSERSARVPLPCVRYGFNPFSSLCHYLISVQMLAFPTQCAPNVSSSTVEHLGIWSRRPLLRLTVVRLKIMSLYC